jgi:hypothetical protein
VGYSLYTSDPFTYPGGGVAAGVTVSVYFSATSVHAPIFHDDLATIPKANPTRTDDAGRVSFWIEPGTYVLLANGIRTTIVVDAIPDPPGPEDYVTRSEVEDMIADAGGSSLPPVTTKGQLYAAQGAGSVGLLAVGTNGQVLSADSATATGLKWIDAAAGGGAVASVFGRTGIVVAQAGDYTKSQVGLGNVDNTSDVNKPISTATQNALDLKESISSHNADVVTLNASIATKADAAATTSALAGKQPLDSDLTTLAGLTATTDNIIQSVAGAWASRTPAQVKTALAIAESDVANLVSDLAAKQPLDSDLTTISGLTATTDNFLQAKASAWASRTPAQVAADLQTLLTIAQSQVTGLTAALAALQPLDSDLTTIAGLTATTDNMIQSVAGAWASRTPAQVKTALAIAQSDVSGLTAALAALAPLASPALTGTATAVNLTASGRLMISPDTITISANHAATDASLGNFFKIAANANFTLDNPTNPTDGQRITWQITQDGTGSRVLTLDTAFGLGADITAVVLSTGANKCDFLGAIYDSTATKWRVVSLVKGY